jgi:hypothetical protein
MSTSGLLAWALVFWVAYQVKLGLATEAGQKLIGAIAERIRGSKP